MFYHPRYRQRPEFAQGVKDIASAGLGIGAWGMMTGVAMVQMGLSPFEAILMTLLVFAGSAQLAATPLMMAGSPIWVILFTALCVNLRFVVFSAHMRQYTPHLSLKERLITGYLTGDMPYVFFVKRFAQVGSTPEEREAQLAYFWGCTLVMFSSWHLFSLIGIALAGSIPLAWGLGFAGVLALLGVLAGLITNGQRALAMGVGGFAAIAAYGLNYRLNIVVAIAATVAVSLIWDQLKGRHHHKDQA